MPQIFTDEQIQRAQLAKTTMDGLEELRASITDPAALESIDQVLATLSELRTAVVDNESVGEEEEIDLDLPDNDKDDWDVESNVTDLDLNSDEVSEDDEELSDTEIDNDATQPNSTEPTPAIDPNSTQTTSTFNIQFAPTREPVGGKYQVCFASLNWTDKQGPALSTVNSLSKRSAQIFKVLSRGAMKVEVAAMTVNTGLAYKPVNLAKAVTEAKTAAKKSKRSAGDYDVQAVFHSAVRGYSNATGGVVYLDDTSLRTVLHEISHLRKNKAVADRCSGLGLEHANAMKKDPAKGTATMTQYFDGSSFMGRFATTQLNVPELYYLGWTLPKKIAMCKVGDAPVELEIEGIYAKPTDYKYAQSTAGRFHGVIFSKPGKDSMLSIIQVKADKQPPKKNGKQPATVYTNVLAVYDYYGGADAANFGPGTKRQLVFKNSATFDGWNVESLSTDGNSAKVRIKAPAV